MATATAAAKSAYLLSLLSILAATTTVVVSSDPLAASFAFGSFGQGSLLLLGDATLADNGTVELTTNKLGAVGRALYPRPIRFITSDDDVTASFRTSFTFSISSQSNVSYGDGFAFVMVNSNSYLGGAGGWLGLVNGTTAVNSSSNSSTFVAVEFDTFMNVEFGDPNDNHVGVDVNSVHSIQFADAGSAALSLRAGEPITAWIDYDAGRQELEVSASYDSEHKPQKRLLSLSISLAGTLDETMFVGFSASSGGGSGESHSIHSWSFSTYGLVAPSPTAPPTASLSPTAATAAAPTVAVPQPPTIRRCSGRRLCIQATAPFVAISATSSVVTAAVFIGCIWWLCRRRSSSRATIFSRAAIFSTTSSGNSSVKTTTTTSSKKKLDSSSSLRSMSFGTPRQFSYKELSAATKGFSSSRVLGQGASGIVYRGDLFIDGNEVAVAVKRASDKSQGMEEFLSELSIIACLRHRNLVQLQGWCRDRRELLLVYDYMPNGSLDKLLFGGGQAVLSWKTRFKAVMGVANALAYLHGEWERQVLHRDVKASNIMLDARLEARLGDFGLARLVDHDGSPEATITAGTLGYLAPEYLHSGKATAKTDVFSYGTVALEVATGRRPIEKTPPSSPTKHIPGNPNERRVLVDWVWGLHRDGRLVEAADPRLGSEFDPDEMLLLLRIGLLCCHPDPEARPTMKQIVQYLSAASVLPPVPRFKPRPSFVALPPLSIQDIMGD